MNQAQNLKVKTAENITESSKEIADITAVSGMETRDHNFEGVQNKNGVSPKNQRVGETF